uniref:Fascin actin-bundling protein 3 n=1 Tax=Chelonoidis abingdonii TaxID=106734 RepID=A0A8C0H895_CHEAB
ATLMTVYSILHTVQVHLNQSDRHASGGSLGEGSPTQCSWVPWCPQGPLSTVVELLGHQGRYLVVDPDGSVRCGKPASVQQSQFLLELHRSGKWTLQLLDSKKYLESDGEDVFCVSRSPSPYQKWLPQLAMHVHIVLYNPTHQCYARADADLDRVWVDTPVPYLEECGFVLRFRNGMYHLETSSHKFVSRAEKLAKKPSAQTAFNLNLKPKCLAFLSDQDGCVLYPQDKRGRLCLGDNPKEKEEWFVIKRCPQWVSLKTKAKRYVSIICVNQNLSNDTSQDPSCIKHILVIPYSYRNNISMKNLGCNVTPLTCICHPSPPAGPGEAFGVRLANRSFLVLRGRYGYVGSSACHDQGPAHAPLSYHQLSFLPSPAHGRSFWSLSSDGTFRTWGKFALNFCLEIQGSNILAVLAPNGYYMRGDRSGTLLADSEEVTSECLWEF